MDDQTELTPVEQQVKENAWSFRTREKWARKILKGAAQPELESFEMSEEKGKYQVDRNSISRTSTHPPTQIDIDAAEYLRRGEGAGWHAALYNVNAIQFNMLMQEFLEGVDNTTPQRKKDLTELLEMERIIADRHKSRHDQQVATMFNPSAIRGNVLRAFVHKAADWYAKQTYDIGS